MGKKISTVVFKKDQMIMESLKEWYKENVTDNRVAHVTAIGAVEDPEVGFIKQSGEYVWKVLKGEWELLHASGTISMHENGDIIPHIHVSLSDIEMKAYGGHLRDAKISVTFEGRILIDKRHKGVRKPVKDSTLNLLNLEKVCCKEKKKH